MKLKDIDGAGAIYVVEPMDEYNASRVLMTDVLLSKIAEFAKDDLVIGIPERDLFLAVAHANAPGRSWLWQVVAQKYAACPVQGQVSPGLYVFRRETGRLDDME